MLNMNLNKVIDCSIHFFGIMGGLTFVSGFFFPEADLLTGAFFAVAALATFAKASKK